jgi:ketopantoate hydroxymethyltransferase
VVTQAVQDYSREVRERQFPEDVSE